MQKKNLKNLIEQLIKKKLKKYKILCAKEFLIN